MKVIFLDFDGVLNSARYLASSREAGLVIDPTRMILLKQIVDATGAGIVLSTSWREHWSASEGDCNYIGTCIHRIFDKFDLRILDKTPHLNTGRESEILTWLDENPKVRSFVVLDDRLLCTKRLNGCSVKTSNFRNGLDETDVQKAIGILNAEEVGL